jgi:DNA-binding CsgD family transcriptional regulator
MVLLGFASHVLIGVVLGHALRLVGSLLGTYTVGIALSRVTDARMAGIGVSVAVVLATVVATFMPAPSGCAAVVLDGLLTFVSLGLTWHAAMPTMADVACSPGVELRAPHNPRSFLPLSHRLFVLILIFSLAVGFGSSLRLSDETPPSSGLGLAALAAVVAVSLLCPAKDEHGRKDVLFVLSILLVVAGFLVAPLDGLGVGTANDLLCAGRLAFGILSWTALAALCARNPSGSMMVLACSEVVGGVGAFLGYELGYCCNVLLVAYPQGVVLATSAVVLALFAYALIGLRGFSFSRTICEVEPAAPVPTPESVTPSLDVACDELAGRLGLTRREREVLGLLARGHNGYHLSDELGLSYNTVKTHTKRIYSKLDVHSQQELIELVERDMPVMA